MMAVRQDAWTPDDDLILAEVTLRHIRDGGTQLSAFEEVGERIGRTAAACGFRWNSCVRKKYEAAIQIAKSQRQKRNRKNRRPDDGEWGAIEASQELTDSNNEETAARIEAPISMDAIIRYLRQSKSIVQESEKRIKALEKELQQKDEQIRTLQEENGRLSSEVNHVQSDYQVVNDDYKALIQIMDRARKLAFLEEEDEESKPRFKMDANGNLERVE